MKRVYVNKEDLYEAVSEDKGEITPFGFLSHAKLFLKKLMKDPVNADIDDYLKSKGLNRKDLIQSMIDKGILVSRKRIEPNPNDLKEENLKGKGKENFVISYDVVKDKFYRKMKRLFTKFFESNESDILTDEILKEEGEGGAVGGTLGGVAGCQTVGVNGFDSFGYEAPMKVKTEENDEEDTDVVRRKIYLTREQAEQLKETTTVDAGNYEHDVPVQFNGGNDPSYDHRNMMADSWNMGRKIGVRRKRK